MVRKRATYWVRFRIPKHLTARLGTAEINRSLWTVQHDVGRIRCAQATVWFRETMTMLSNMTAPTRADLETSAQNFFQMLAEDVDQPRNFPDDNFDEHVAWNLEETADRISELDDQLKANDFDETVQTRASEILASAGGIWKDLTDRETLFALQQSARAEREQLELLRHGLTHPASCLSIHTFDGKHFIRPLKRSYRRECLLQLTNPERRWRQPYASTLKRKRRKT
jgi:hypothetical protein